MNQQKQNELFIVYQGSLTNRLRYVVTTLFGERLGLAPRIVQPGEAPTGNGHAVIGYGSSDSNPYHTIPACGLLSEAGTDRPEPIVTHPDGYPVLFEDATQPGQLLPFDMLAATFWLISRYEEHQPFTPDDHGRFTAKHSLAGKHDLLLTPLADVWLLKLKEKLNTLFPTLQISLPTYRFLPTFDIDSPFAYRHKPWHIQYGGFVKALLKGRINEVRKRAGVLLGVTDDPFNTFDQLETLHAGKEQPILFFLMGRYNRYNKNPHPNNRAYMGLIRQLKGTYPVGIHPSYETSDHPERLREEIRHFLSVTGEPVVRSRQHFLRFRLPGTYQELVATGITEEYSMGFAEQPGFRAGTAIPFRFYDLSEEKETPMMVYPVTIMDGTLRDYLRLEPDEAQSLISKLAQTVKEHHGVFISLWHNESLDASARWKGWTNVYKHLVQCCAHFNQSQSITP